MRVSKRFPMAVHSVLFVAVHSPIRRVTSTLVAESIEANPVTIRTLFLDLSEKRDFRDNCWKERRCSHETGAEGYYTVGYLSGSRN